jgi:hypothetical protein
MRAKEEEAKERRESHEEYKKILTIKQQKIKNLQDIAAYVEESLRARRKALDYEKEVTKLKHKTHAGSKVLLEQARQGLRKAVSVERVADQQLNEYLYETNQLNKQANVLAAIKKEVGKLESSIKDKARVDREEDARIFDRLEALQDMFEGQLAQLEQKGYAQTISKTTDLYNQQIKTEKMAL